ncbi:Hypothetical predicted protein, partial [Paramuricea clavata]
IAQSNDFAFLDSSSNKEEYNIRVFVMVTHSVCGALPLGIVLTSDEKKQTLVHALPFYGAYPSTGPKVIMTDNCSELREALKMLHRANSMEFTVDVLSGKARRNDGMGFQKPTAEEQQSAMAKISKVGDNMYRVPSISKED